MRGQRRLLKSPWSQVLDSSFLHNTFHTRTRNGSVSSTLLPPGMIAAALQEHRLSYTGLDWQATGQATLNRSLQRGRF